MKCITEAKKNTPRSLHLLKQERIHSLFHQGKDSENKMDAS